MVTICTTSLTFNNSTFCPHSCINLFCVDLRTNSIISSEWFLQPKQDLLIGRFKLKSLNTIHVHFVPQGSTRDPYSTKSFLQQNKNTKQLRPTASALSTAVASFWLQIFQPPEAITDLQQSSNYWVYYYTKYINFRLFRFIPCIRNSHNIACVHVCVRALHMPCQQPRSPGTSLSVSQDDRGQLS